MNSLLPESLLLLTAAISGAGATLGALRIRQWAFQRRRNQDNALTEAARLAWDSMRNTSLEDVNTSLSLGREDSFESSRPPFHSYWVKGGDESSRTC